jgi:hypothetical protein
MGDPPADDGAGSGPADSDAVVSGDGDPLLAWCLASFHASALVALPVAAAHAIDPRAVGDLLGGLGTGVGLGLYLVLWGATWATNRRWLAESDFAAAGRTIRAGAKWGAPAGLAVLAALAVVLLVRTTPFLAAVVAVVGGALSILVGGLIGAALAAVDVGLYRLTATLSRAVGSTSGDGGRKHER